MLNPPLSEQIAARLNELYPAHEWKAETREDGEYILLEFLEAKLTVEREGEIPDTWVLGFGQGLIEVLSKMREGMSELVEQEAQHWISGAPTGQPVGVLSGRPGDIVKQWLPKK